MAIIFDGEGYDKKAIEFYEKALKIFEKTNGENCFEAADSLHNMGVTYFNKRDYLQALNYYKKAELIYKKSSEKNQYYGSTLFNIGVTLFRIPNYRDAAATFERTILAFQTISGEVQESAYWMAKCLRRLNEE